MRTVKNEGGFLASMAEPDVLVKTNSEGIARLVQVVADRDFSAEGIAAAGDRQFVDAVGKCVHQDRYFQP